MTVAWLLVHVGDWLAATLSGAAGFGGALLLLADAAVALIFGVG